MKKIVRGLGVCLIACWSASSHAQQGQPPTATQQSTGPTASVEVGAAAVNLADVFLVQEFLGDGDASQCNGAAYGRIISSANVFSPAIRIDTDDRSGGCLYRIGIVDTSGILNRVQFRLTMGFYADGDVGQCGNQGTWDVPVAASMANLAFSNTIRMDMDNRGGGCQQVWTVSGPSVVLDVNFFADGDPGQCGNIGSHTASQGRPVQIRLDTDNRSGGCLQSLRLRSAQVGFDDAFVASSRSAPINMLSVPIR
jgi:hypothetical protein